MRNCGIKREELFVVSKVAAEHKTYETAMTGINETLEKMGPVGIIKLSRLFSVLMKHLKRWDLIIWI